MKNKFKLGLLLSSMMFSLSSIADDESSKNTVKGIQLEGFFEISNGVSVSYFTIAIANRNQIDSAEPSDYPLPTLPPAKPYVEFESGRGFGGVYYGEAPFSEMYDIDFRLFESYLGPVPPPGLALVKIKSNDSMGNELIYWDAPVPESIISKHKDGSVSVHLDSCELITGDIGNCTGFDVSWIPNGHTRKKHKSKSEEVISDGLFPMSVVRTSKHSLKSADVNVTTNNTIIGPDGVVHSFSETGSGTGSIYSVKFTVAPLKDKNSSIN